MEACRQDGTGAGRPGRAANDKFGFVGGGVISRSWRDIDKDLGVVRRVTPQAPVRRVYEILVDLETSGPAAQAPGRENRRAGTGEGIDDQSARG